MNISQLLKKGSVRRSLIASYLSILILSIFASYAVFTFNYTQMKKQIDQTFTATNSQLSRLIDSYQERVQNSVTALCLSESARSLTGYRTGTVTFQQFQLYRTLQKQLLAEMTVTDYIDGIFVVFPKSKTVLTEQSIYYNYDFSYKCRSTLGMTTEEWENFILFDGYRKNVILKSTVDGQARILLAQKNQTTRNGKMPDILVITVLKTDSIRLLMNEMLPDDQTFAVLLDQQTGSFLSSSLSAPEVSWNESYQLTAKNATLFSNQVSENWQCGLIIPSKTYRHYFLPLSIAMGIYLILYLVVGFMMILYLSKRQYTPIQQISQQMLSIMKEKAVPSSEENELSQIGHSLALLLEQQTKMGEENLSLRRRQQLYTLTTLISGNIQDEMRLLNYVSNNEIYFRSNRFLVVLYSIDQIGSLDAQINTDADSALKSLVDTIVRTAESSIDSNLYSCHAFDYENQVACIISCPFDSSKEQIYEDVQKNIQNIKRYFEDTFHMVLSAGISELHIGLNSICTCYREAEEASEYLETLGKSGESILHEQLPSSSVRPDFYREIAEKGKLFCNAVQKNDYTSAAKTFEEIKEASSFIRSRQEETLFIASLIPFLYSAFETSKEQGNLPDSYAPEKYLHYKAVQPLFDDISSVLSQLTQQSMIQRSSADIEREQEMVAYIDQNLSNPNLNVTMAADYFGMSSSYYSRMFKKITGIGLLDYIHMRRIKAAKEIMQEHPKATLKEIAEMVGYSNSLALNRAFRKYEGISPSVYRDIR